MPRTIIQIWTQHGRRHGCRIPATAWSSQGMGPSGNTLNSAIIFKQLASRPYTHLGAWVSRTATSSVIIPHTNTLAHHCMHWHSCGVCPACAACRRVSVCKQSCSSTTTSDTATPSALVMRALMAAAHVSTRCTECLHCSVRAWACAMFCCRMCGRSVVLGTTAPPANRQQAATKTTCRPDADT